jgi:hypothetical protein
MDTNQLSDLYEIQKLKAQYFRFLDTKQWGDFRALFTDDMKLYIEPTPLPESNDPTFPSPEALVGYLSSSHPDKVTVHQGHMAEIDFISQDAARGIWAMFDWVDDPGHGGAWQGFGHYHENYVRCPDGRWRISEVRLTRLRVDSVEPRRPGPIVRIDPQQGPTKN